MRKMIGRLSFLTLIGTSLLLSATFKAFSSPSLPLESTTIEVSQGIKLHTLQQGSGSTILMLHGFPSYSGSWKPYLKSLSDRFRVVAPDLRGYNLSSQPSEVEAYRLETLMQDVRQLVAGLGEEKVCLVGHDWGGLLSWYLAAHFPETFSKLVILNAPHPKVYQKLYTENLEQKVKALYVPALIAPNSEDLLKFGDYQVLKSMLFGATDYPFSREEKAEVLAAWRQGLKGPINYYRSYIPRQEKLAAAMPLVEVPTLVLWGEKDPALILKNLEGLEAFVPDLTVVRYPRASHWLNYEKIPEVSEEIATFCGG